VAVGLGLFILFYVLKQANPQALWGILRAIDPARVLAVIASTAVSYLFIAAVLHRLLQLIDQPLRFFPVLQITLISCTLNYLMALGGLSGVAAKVYMLARKKVPPSKTLSVSMVHGFVTNTVALVFVFFGFFFLSTEYQLSRRQIGAGIAIMVIALAMTWVTIQVLVDTRFRKHLWDLLMLGAMTACRVLRHPHWIHVGRAEAFYENFNASILLLKSNANRLWRPAGYAFLDWLFMFLTLKWSFQALHYPISNRTLLVGFSIGIFTSIFSITPGALGIMEGSMAGSFYLMGYDYNQALLATLLYRIVYFLLPVLVSCFFYRSFFPPVALEAAAHHKDNAEGEEFEAPGSGP
jgi:hypothetical protein